MAWNAREFEIELKAAVGALDRPRTAELVGELMGHVASAARPYPAKSAERILRALRDQREFVLLQRLADAFIQAGRDDPGIRLQYAQALIDQGNLTAGVAVLQALLADVPEDAPERAEVRGLLGRAHKQMYLAAAQAPARRRAAFLAPAIAYYGDVYDESALRWHGINAAALLERARRDRVTLDGVKDPGTQARKLALEILDAIKARGRRADMWDKGTAVEACVALGLDDEALEWLEAYLRAPKINAFAVGATLRQLTEIWDLDAAREPGARLLPVLQAELLARRGGPDVVVGAADLEPDRIERIEEHAGFEKVLGSERFATLRWFETALQRCRSIARIEDPIEGGVGTGFLVEGKTLGYDLPAVLITNAHVVSETEAGAVAPDRAVATFRALEGEAREYRVARVLDSWPRDELDVTVIELEDRPDQALCCPLARNRPNLKGKPPARTYIVGHPSGAPEVMLSIRDNQVLDADETKLHYRTPTLGGSSGSPVFNGYWELIAVHHAGLQDMPRLNGKSGTYPANEGIWIDRVVEARRRAARARSRA